MQVARSVGSSTRPLSCARCLARRTHHLPRAAFSSLHSESRPSTPSLSRRLQYPSPSSSSGIPSNRRHINTIQPEEISHFSSLSQTWWNETGDFNVLQRMNKVRVEFLKERLKMVKRHEENFTMQDLKAIDGPSPLKGMKVLDVGCGGGLFAERLARLGAYTLAIDASEENVKAAIMHASQDPLLSTKLDNGTLEYRASAVEALTNGYTTAGPEAQVNYSSDLKAEQEKDFFGSFDVVFAMEVVEHVADPKGFLRCLADLVKPGGHIILSTISRTPLARLVAITLAESPLIRLAPAGSHTYSKFIRPEEIMTFFEDELNWPCPSSSSISASAAEVGNLGNHLGQEQKSLRYNMEVRGTTYLPWAGEWKLFPADDGKGVVQDLAKSCNYFFGARKPVLAGQ